MKTLIWSDFAKNYKFSTKMKLFRKFKPSTSFLMGVGLICLLPSSWFMKVDYYYHYIMEDDVFDFKEQQKLEESK